MTHTNSKLTLIFSILFGISTLPLHAMEEQPTDPQSPAPYTQDDARKKWELVQEKARLNEERAAQERARKTEESKQRMLEADKRLDEVLKTNRAVLDEADAVLQKAQKYFAPEHEDKEPTSPKPQSFVIPVESLDKALNNDPELNALLDNFFNPEAGPSNAQVIEDAFGPETGLAATAIELPGTPLAPRVAPVVELPQVEPVIERPIPAEPIPVAIQVVHVPFEPDPVVVEHQQPAPEPAPIHKIDESFVASVLNNVLGAKAHMATAGTLGLVHYLYENKVFTHAVEVRSPRMKAFLHDYALPTAREALAAHLIQLLLPHLPYLRDKEIRSFGTVNYLGCFITTKMLGNTALYFVKMITDSEQGKKLVTHYNRLPKKTQNTIAKVLPWLDFARNMFMARSLASYFE